MKRSPIYILLFAQNQKCIVQDRQGTYVLFFRNIFKEKNKIERILRNINQGKISIKPDLSEELNNTTDLNLTCFL